MPMTRQRAQSSFTVEIKRATRRTPEVLTLTKTTSLHRSSLADQVFSRVSGRPLSPQVSTGEPPRLAQQTSPPSPSLPGAGSPELQAQPMPRRVLPDLLSVPADLVAERIKQEDAEKAARRRVSRKIRKRTSPQPSLPEVQDETSAPTVVISVTGTSREVMAEPKAAPQPATQTTGLRVRRWTVLAVKARRAERQGRPLPRLPAGQRWKRNLPAVCW